MVTELLQLSASQILALPLVVALLAQLSAQAFKVVLYSITERRLAFDRFIHAAGIPSAHTAFVTAVTAAVGIRNGVLSDIFAVSFVFSAIVIYDSFRLRGNVQTHAKVLNQLLKPRLDVADGEYVSEHIGHTIPEVAAGIIWGLMFAVGLVL